MSYILDALKRSEQERHQGELSPTTIDTIMYKPRPVKHQWWPWMLIIVLLINLGVYLYFQITSARVVSEEYAPAELAAQNKENGQSLGAQNQAALIHETPSVELNLKSSAQAEMSRSDSVRPLPEHVLQAPSLNKFYDVNQVRPESSPISRVPLSQQETSQQPIVQPHKEYNEQGFEVIRPKQMSASKAEISESRDDRQNEPAREHFQNIPDNYELIEPAKDVPAVSVTPENADSQTDQGRESQRLEQVPHLSDLPASFQSGIPNIRFNSHIYSDQPSERRVMINDLYLREGQSFSGMRIETIGEFYIELSKQGQHFKLPVLRDWFSPR